MLDFDMVLGGGFLDGGVTIKAFEQMYTYIDSISVYEIKPIVSLYNDVTDGEGELLEQMDEETLYMYGRIE